MGTADGKRGTVLVTDAGRGSAITIIRSLGRRGYRVIAADSRRDSPGFRSRFAQRSVVYSPPQANADQFCIELLEAVRAHGVDLIVPVTDLTVQPLSVQRERFEPLVRLALPEAEALAIVSDKSRTLELARRVGVPVPPTSLVKTSIEALEHAAAFGWPVVLKPQASHLLRGGTSESFEVTYAGSPADLEQKMRRFEGRCGVLLQRYCPGAGHGVELLMSRGRPLAAFQHRRLREVPLTGGASSYRESVPLDARLLEDSVRLLSELRWTGLVMVEFKVTPDERYLMEINGRVWGSLPLAVAAGVDFPTLAAELFLRGETAVQSASNGAYALGLRSRDLERDLIWIGSVLSHRQRYAFLPIPPRHQAVLALLELFDPRRKVDVLAWDDPLPAVAQLPNIAAKLWRKRRISA